MKKVPLVLAMVLLAGTVASAQTTTRWLHVKVEEMGERAETVRVNIPLAVAEKVLPAISFDNVRGGKLKLREGKIILGDERLDVDVRAILEALRTVGDAEFVTVESADETVRVAKQGGYLVATVDERTGSEDKVNVRIPFAVVEALLSGAADELDLLAAVRALSQHGDGVLVTVQDKKTNVRVWVDSRNTSE